MGYSNYFTMLFGPVDESKLLKIFTYLRDNDHLDRTHITRYLFSDCSVDGPYLTNEKPRPEYKILEEIKVTDILKGTKLSFRINFSVQPTPEILEGTELMEMWGEDDHLRVNLPVDFVLNKGELTLQIYSTVSWDAAWMHSYPEVLTFYMQFSEATLPEESFLHGDYRPAMVFFTKQEGVLFDLLKSGIPSIFEEEGILSFEEHYGVINKCDSIEDFSEIFRWHGEMLYPKISKKYTGPTVVEKEKSDSVIFECLFDGIAEESYLMIFDRLMKDKFIGLPTGDEYFLADGSKIEGPLVDDDFFVGSVNLNQLMQNRDYLTFSIDINLDKENRLKDADDIYYSDGDQTLVFEVDLIPTGKISSTDLRMVVRTTRSCATQLKERVITVFRTLLKDLNPVWHEGI